eukprot:m.105014 g.105014  ORF g.105014 m.105014 type:complete len:55 (-) comp10544_c0_seq4:2937-3101(-)
MHDKLQIVARAPTCMRVPCSTCACVRACDRVCIQRAQPHAMYSYTDASFADLLR